MFCIGSRFDVTRVKRLIIEAVEISINLCNHSLDRYGLSKFYDVIDQILPTAYVLNTSYWVFYSTKKGNCLCICSSFGLRCPHYRNGNHWINVQPIPEPQECLFFSCQPVTLSCFEPDVTVEPVFENNYVFYDVIMKLKFQLNFLRDLRVVRSVVELPELTMMLRYHFTKEYYPLENVIVQFRPIPTFHPSYGRHCTILLQDQFQVNAKDLTATCVRHHTVVVKEMAMFKIAGNPVLFTIFKRPIYNPFINNLSINPVKMISPHLLASTDLHEIDSEIRYHTFNNINMNQFNVNVVNTTYNMPFLEEGTAVPIVTIPVSAQMYGNNVHFLDDCFRTPPPRSESHLSTGTTLGSHRNCACKTKEEHKKQNRIEYQTQLQPHYYCRISSNGSEKLTDTSTSVNTSSNYLSTSEEYSTEDATNDERAMNYDNKAQEKSHIPITEQLEMNFPRPLVFDNMDKKEYLNFVREVISEDLDESLKIKVVIQMTKLDEETRNITLTASQTR